MCEIIFLKPQMSQGLTGKVSVKCIFLENLFCPSGTLPKKSRSRFIHVDLRTYFVFTRYLLFASKHDTVVVSTVKLCNQ